MPVVEDVLSASGSAERHQLSFWDAMILNSAVGLRCPTIHTGDLAYGQVVDGVATCGDRPNAWIGPAEGVHVGLAFRARPFDWTPRT